MNFTNHLFIFTIIFTQYMTVPSWHHFYKHKVCNSNLIHTILKLMFVIYYKINTFYVALLHSTIYCIWHIYIQINNSSILLLHFLNTIFIFSLLHSSFILFFNRYIFRMYRYILHYTSYLLYIIILVYVYTHSIHTCRRSYIYISVVLHLHIST